MFEVIKYYNQNFKSIFKSQLLENSTLNRFSSEKSSIDLETLKKFVKDWKIRLSEVKDILDNYDFINSESRNYLNKLVDSIVKNWFSAKNKKSYDAFRDLLVKSWRNINLLDWDTIFTALIHNLNWLNINYHENNFHWVSFNWTQLSIRYDRFWIEDTLYLGSNWKWAWAFEYDDDKDFEDVSKVSKKLFDNDDNTNFSNVTNHINIHSLLQKSNVSYLDEDYGNKKEPKLVDDKTPEVVNDKIPEFPEKEISDDVSNIISQEKNVDISDTLLDSINKEQFPENWLYADVQKLNEILWKNQDEVILVSNNDYYDFTQIPDTTVLDEIEVTDDSDFSPNSTDFVVTEKSINPHSDKVNQDHIEKTWIDDAKLFYKENFATNNSIKKIQRLLKINDDGIFWPETYWAIIKFQKNNNLNQDWKAWNKTLLAMWLISQNETSKDFYSKLEEIDIPDFEPIYDFHPWFENENN